ncbi:hypothetical protein [Hymenobacter sp. APR13]|nr:hypothetical protein [Hymenobacter sp. APR13]
MKKVLLFAVLGVLSLNSCRTKCPAYSTTKPATHTAAPIMASNAAATPRQ